MNSELSGGPYAAAVPTITGTPTDIMALVIEERRRNFFLEGGHRLRDMIRFRGTARMGEEFRWFVGGFISWTDGG